MLEGLKSAREQSGLEHTNDSPAEIHQEQIIMAAEEIAATAAEAAARYGLTDAELADAFTKAREKLSSEKSSH